jgi:hypothetical protein
MADRRSLVEGMSVRGSEVRSAEEEFVFKGTTKGSAPRATPAITGSVLPSVLKEQGTIPVTRVPLTTRIRSDLAAALKRASLERQLNGQSPHTLQDILEDALEPWLRVNGYLK